MTPLPKILFSACLLMVWAGSVRAAETKILSKEKAIEMVGDMFLEDMPKDWSGIRSGVIKVIGPANKMCAVLIKPPYREFPNVVLFQFDGKWKRVKEVLGIGLGLASSELDTHREGSGVDFTIGKKKSESTYDFQSAEVANMVKATVDNGGAISVYPKFFHMHPSQAPYMMDQTYLLKWGPRLTDMDADTWLKDSCILYATPNAEKGEIE